MKILVAIPNFSYVSPLFLDSIASLCTMLGCKYPSKDDTLLWCRDTRTYRHLARAQLWAATRAAKADGMLWIDDDMVFTGHDVAKLIDSGLDVVSALYFARGLPTHPLMAVSDGAPGQYRNILDWEHGVKVKVDVAGLGLMWVSGKVIAAVENPFKMPNPPQIGEDVLFCESVRKAGFQIWVDTSVVAGHISEVPRIISQKTYEEQGRFVPLMPKTPFGTQDKAPITGLEPLPEIGVKHGGDEETNIYRAGPGRTAEAGAGSKTS